MYLVPVGDRGDAQNWRSRVVTPRTGIITERWDDLFASFCGETRTKVFNHHQREPQEEWTALQLPVFKISYSYFYRPW